MLTQANGRRDGGAQLIRRRVTLAPQARLLAIAGLMFALPFFGAPASANALTLTGRQPEDQPQNDVHTTQPAGEAAAEGEGGATIQFGPKFVEGWVTVYEHTADSEGGQSFGEQNFPSNSHTNLVMRVHVLDVDADGNAIVKMTYDRVVMHGDAFFGGKYEYDSTKPLAVTSPDVGGPLTLVRDMEIYAEVGADGKVKTLRGNRDAFQALQEVPQLAGRAGEFSEEGLKQMLESFWIIGTVGESYSVGQQWSESAESDWAGMGKMVVTTSYDFVGATEETATVNFLVDIALNVDLEAQQEGSQMDILGVDFTSGDNHGSMVWDRELNQLQGRESQLSYVLTIKQKGIFEDQQEMSNTQTQNVTAKLTRLSSEMGEIPTELPSFEDEDEVEGDEGAAAGGNDDTATDEPLDESAGVDDDGGR